MAYALSLSCTRPWLTSGSIGLRIVGYGKLDIESLRRVPFGGPGRRCQVDLPRLVERSGKQSLMFFCSRALKSNPSLR
jgi:hypothetical protein